MKSTEHHSTGPDPKTEETLFAGTEPAIGDVLGGRFLLRKALGRGATGTVFAALDTSVGQKIAVKILHPGLRDSRTRERLNREVRASRPSHPNAVTVYDLHEADGHVFLSLELVEGRSLRELLADRERLEPDEVVSIGRQIAPAIRHLHQRGMTHRDVKPGNILVTPDGVAKLCDMGLARPLEEGVTVTETEMVMGTPAYMAPEQAMGGELTGASDVYALGLTLHQSLTGEVPLREKTAVATLTRRQKARPPHVRRTRPGCPRWLDRLVRRMLEPAPRDRPSISDVERVLEARRFWPKPRRRSLAAAGIMAFIALAIVIGGHRLVTSQTVQVEIDGKTVHGIDVRGNETWRFDLPAPPVDVVRADLDGDGRDEIVVAGRQKRDPSDSLTSVVQSYVVVLTDRGELMSRLVPETAIRGWGYPYRLELSPAPVALDIDGDGWVEVVALCQRPRFYPTVVMVYWPRWDIWEELLHHPGNLYTVAAAPEAGLGGLRFLAFNNQLLMTPVYGHLAVIPPGKREERQGPATGFMVAPPAGALAATRAGRWKAYLPLEAGRPESADNPRQIGIETDGSIKLDFLSVRTILDNWFNPVPGPNAGRDLRKERLDFFGLIVHLTPGRSAITVDGVRQILQEARDTSRPLLAEAPYEIILAGIGARALAVAGDLEGAITLLKTTTDRLQNDDLLFRLAHLEAVGGDLNGARKTTERLIDTGITPRSHFDAPLLLLRLAVHTRSDETVAASLSYLTHKDTGSIKKAALQAALRARANLWWDELSKADCQVHSVDLDAGGDAIACLARWRLGRTEQNDIDAMERLIDLEPEAAEVGRVALAAALLGNGRPAEAVVRLDQVIAILEPSSRDDFASLELLELARALRVVALESAGETETARIAARVLSRALQPDLLPGILVREVLARTTNG